MRWRDKDKNEIHIHAAVEKILVIFRAWEKPLGHWGRWVLIVLKVVTIRGTGNWGLLTHGRTLSSIRHNDPLLYSVP